MVNHDQQPVDESRPNYEFFQTIRVVDEKIQEKKGWPTALVGAVSQFPGWLVVFIVGVAAIAWIAVSVGRSPPIAILPGLIQLTSVCSVFWLVIIVIRRELPCPESNEKPL